MVNPLYIFAISFAIAFLIGFFQNISKGFTNFLFYLALVSILAISGFWFYQNLFGSVDPNIYTAGFKPPYSINLRMGLEESFLTFFINLVGLLSSLIIGYKMKFIRSGSAFLKSLYLMMIMGLNGIVMTRDIFNLFVFMEIASISTYSLIALQQNKLSLSAGFKYLIAGGIASSFYLLGTIYLYRLTGTLNLDTMIAANHLIVGKVGMIAFLFFIFSLLIELKPFPANGWALDVYQAVDPAIVSIISVASSGALFYILYKVMPLFPVKYVNLITIAGVLTFAFSNLLGLKQKNVRRLLGYSSIAQVGLLVTALGLMHKIGFGLFSKESILVILGGLFLNHFFAKAGLFWLSDFIGVKFSDWSALKKKPVLLLIFGTFVFALVGLPPFPGFWSKWELITQLAANGYAVWIWVILTGSLLEAVYLIRWFVLSVKGDTVKTANSTVNHLIPIYVFFTLIVATGIYFSQKLFNINLVFVLPVIVALAIFFVDWLKDKFKAIFIMLVLGIYAYRIVPLLHDFRLVFAVIFLGGSLVQIIATMASKESRKGFYAYLVMMILALGNLLLSQTTLEFFLSWEFMTLSSFLLILRGRKAAMPALTYVIFSLAGAYSILYGFSLAFANAGNLNIISLISSAPNAIYIYILIAVGFLIKSGAVLFHIWVPGGYSEAEDDASPIISSVLSKAGIFGLAMIILTMGRSFLNYEIVQSLLGWIGVLTALFGALMAVFQEDIKKTLAYSSMGQIGYIILTLSMVSHLGFVSAFYLSINHLFFKGLLFLAIAGVISRTGTRKMYEMGGLIKKMPLSFISVLIGIIALSGVPPLSGFGSKWLVYTSLIEKGWYFKAGVAFFSSGIAFLYLFRLIHAIFLGQLKTSARNIKEASVWYLIPQYIFIFAIMGISMYPNLILKPIIASISPYIPTTVDWNGYQVISSLGYWNGNIVMMVTIGVFIVPLILLLLRVKMVQKVKQFNIVFAAERPFTPETSHFAYNFYSHYQKALGILVKPIVTGFWNYVRDIFFYVSQSIRQIYTGNGQTYALHIMFYFIILYVLLGVK